MIELGQLWQHKSMVWLRIRAHEFNSERSGNMIKFVVETMPDEGTNGVEIEFDNDYVVTNYWLVHELHKAAWEV